MKTLPEFKSSKEPDNKARADDVTDDITLEYRPEILRRNLIKLFNLTAQDLELRYGVF